jgi:hypothetical protein
MEEKNKTMIKVINDNTVDKDIRLMFALDLLYQDEISFDKFKEVLDECGCFVENRANAKIKSDEYWNNLMLIYK